MEVASGVNIFVTETAANKLSGEDNQTEDGMYEVQHKEEALDCRNQKQHPREGPKSDFTKIFWIKLGPTKKRVQIEIVAELENLSLGGGVTKQKNWKQMVTHGSKLALKLEISVDIHGIRDGPKAPSLGDLDFSQNYGHTFYFMGDFTPSYKGYLHDLVVGAGGKVMYRKPVLGDHSTPLNGCSAKTVIIYSIELPRAVQANRRKFSFEPAEALASCARAVVASNSVDYEFPCQELENESVASSPIL
ncbi:hypothetical protein ACS0TY_028970 [Phlomoides rotata]